MIRRFDPDDAAAAATVDLSREADFALGPLAVAPAALSIGIGTWSQRLEPRAMQVLVLLARASPAVVGRGELNARVWGGRVVGEDAINRAVQTLRRVAADAPQPPAFGIETVPRVGYRLKLADSVAAPPPSLRNPEADPRPPDTALVAAALPARQAPARPDRRIAGVVVAALAVLAAILGWRGLATHGDAPAVWRIAASTALDDLPAGASDVALSPDGRRLAYRGQDAGGRDRVFVRAADDGGVGTPVSPADVDARRPAWSPDSTTLAFAGYDAGRPCRLYVQRAGGPVASAGACETVRDPRLAWSADGRALLFGDASGENAVQRIGAVRVADGQRLVLSNPPGDSMGDALPIPHGSGFVFQRQFGWADEGWIARDTATGGEHLLWRRRGVAGSVAAPLPDGALAIAWTRAGASGLDIVDAGGRISAQPVALGPVTGMSSAGSRLLVETDRSESALARADGASAPATPLFTVRGKISGPIMLLGGQLRVPVASAGIARIWQRDADGSIRPWGNFTAPRISGLALSPDGQLTAALVTANYGREIVLFDAAGKPMWRWNPHARSLNPAAWTSDGRHLIAPILDGAGWRLLTLDPFGGDAPRDLSLPGFAVVLAHHSALYAVRAGESTGIRELWRLDGRARRLPIDLTLFDIVNWRAVDAGVWLPDRSDRTRPRLVLRDAETGRIKQRVDAPGLAGPGSGLAADARGPVYVRRARDAPEYGLLTLARVGG